MLHLDAEGWGVPPRGSSPGGSSSICYYMLHLDPGGLGSSSGEVRPGSSYGRCLSVSLNFGNMLLDITHGRWRTMAEFVRRGGSFCRGVHPGVACPSVRSSAICCYKLHLEVGGRGDSSSEGFRPGFRPRG